MEHNTLSKTPGGLPCNEKEQWFDEIISFNTGRDAIEVDMANLSNYWSGASPFFCNLTISVGDPVIATYLHGKAKHDCVFVARRANDRKLFEVTVVGAKFGAPTQFPPFPESVLIADYDFVKMVPVQAATSKPEIKD